jgi:hypothetical protein
MVDVLHTHIQNRTMEPLVSSLGGAGRKWQEGDVGVI